MKHPRTIRVSLVASLLLALPWMVQGDPTVAEDQKASSIHVALEDETASISCGGQKIAQYRHGKVPFKPYVDVFCTPSGVNILRDSPHDHVHHHALMFAIAADGVDFWIESPDQKPGLQVQKEVRGQARNVSQDGTSTRWASIAGDIAWLSAAKEPILSEKREIIAYCPESLGASLLTWSTRLAPSKGKSSVKLSGSHYFGLGMRFVESMDKGGRFSSSTGEAGEVVRGTERLVRAKWCAYTASANGKKVTVALFDHPKNPRHPARIFTMTQPFAYLAATLNLWKEPLGLEAGKSLKLLYGVALWDGEVPKEKIETLYDRWLDLIKD